MLVVPSPHRTDILYARIDLIEHQHVRDDHRIQAPTKGDPLDREVITKLRLSRVSQAINPDVIGLQKRHIDVVQNEHAKSSP